MTRNSYFVVKYFNAAMESTGCAARPESQPIWVYLPGVILLVILLTACGGHFFHRVERGETLYSIGWVYGYDYQQLARWNNIPPPYTLVPGQRVRVAPPSGQRSFSAQEYRTAKSRKTPAPVIEPGKITGKTSNTQRAAVLDKSSVVRKTTAGKRDAKNVNVTTKTTVRRVPNRSGITPGKSSANKPGWRWPTRHRRILRTFSANNPARQGLDIAGEKGSPVLAAATGRVVYAGSGLVRYGRLIIIKHNERYLSAYAHNQKLRVKEGDMVKIGQRIADMGRSGHLGDNLINDQRAKLHFEIRQNGKPVDPMRYLPK